MLVTLSNQRWQSKQNLDCSGEGVCVVGRTIALKRLCWIWTWAMLLFAWSPPFFLLIAQLAKLVDARLPKKSSIVLAMGIKTKDQIIPFYFVFIVSAFWLNYFPWKHCGGTGRSILFSVSQRTDSFFLFLLKGLPISELKIIPSRLPSFVFSDVEYRNIIQPNDWGYNKSYLNNETISPLKSVDFVFFLF